MRRLPRLHDVVAGASPSGAFAKLLIAGALLSLAFGSGVVFAGKRIYPYEEIVRFVKGRGSNAEEGSPGIETAFHTLSSSRFEVASKLGTYSFVQDDGKLAWGGGITVHGNTVVGVTNHGKFFL